MLAFTPFKDSPRVIAASEIFRLGDNEMADVEGDLVPLPPGWYWQAAAPDEAPESNIYGPFATSFDAYNAAQEWSYAPLDRKAKA